MCRVEYPFNVFVVLRVCAVLFLEFHRGYIGLWGYEGSGDLRKYAIGKLTQNSGPSPALSASREWIVAFAYWIMRRTQRTHKCILNFPRPGNRRNASTRIELQYYLNVPYGGLCRRSLRTGVLQAAQDQHTRVRRTVVLPRHPPFMPLPYAHIVYT